MNFKKLLNKAQDYDSLGLYFDADTIDKKVVLSQIRSLDSDADFMGDLQNIRTCVFRWKSLGFSVNQIQNFISLFESVNQKIRNTPFANESYISYIKRVEPLYNEVKRISNSTGSNDEILDFSKLNLNEFYRILAIL
jgi:hypothetical protein